MPASEAYSHVRETATVCGKVTGVHYAANSKGKPTFINFDKPYPNQDFTVMIWDDERAAFGVLRGIQVAKFVPAELLQSTGASLRGSELCRPQSLSGRAKVKPNSYIR